MLYRHMVRCVRKSLCQLVPTLSTFTLKFTVLCRILKKTAHLSQKRTLSPHSEFHLSHVTRPHCIQPCFFTVCVFEVHQYFSMAAFFQPALFLRYILTPLPPISHSQWNSSKYELQVSSMAISVSSCQLERYLWCTQHACQALKREVKSGVSLYVNTAFFKE